MDKVKPTIDEVQIVITAPSRELANQIYQEAQQLARFSQPEIQCQILLAEQINNVN